MTRTPKISSLPVRVAALLLPLVLLSVGSQTAASAAPSCKGKAATVVGTSADDTNLGGTAGNDVIVGLGGKDTIWGGGGNDLICGGAGDDTISGEAGKDALYGDSGNDTLCGDGYEGSDDLIDGGSHVLYQGDWACFHNSVNVNLQGGTAVGQYVGFDTLKGIENVSGSNEVDSLTGDKGPNFLAGRQGDDVLWGRDGSDIIEGGLGSDQNLGGAGLADWIVYFEATSPVELDLMTGEAVSGADTDLVNGFELVVGSDYDDKLFGDARTNYLAGRRGNDELNGRDGLDLAVFYEPVTASLATGTSSPNTPAPNDGSDTFTNLEGLWGSSSSTPDTLIGDEGNNLLRDGLGDDYLDGAGGDDYFYYDGGGDTIVGGNGTYDVVDFFFALSGVEADLSTTIDSFGPGTSLSGTEALIGTPHADMLRGDGGANYLFGNGGKDTLYGMGGPDGLNGGPGTDRLFGNAGFDGCAFSEHSVSCESTASPPFHPLTALRDATARVERRYK